MNTIYITPPGHNVVMRQNPLLRANVYWLQAYRFVFYSLAGPWMPQTILSGTGSDGSHGVRAIKAAGGITISQDEQSAKYNGMPRSAIDTGLFDLCANPHKLLKS